MGEKKTAVFGIYSSREAAERAADALVNAGFTPADLSVLLPENLGNRAIGTEKATKAPEGATAGGGTGAVLGGTLGLLAGIGALAIPGVGPLIAAGPIMATLAGVGVGGAIQKGGILLSVHCGSSDEVKRAKEIIGRTGGEDVSSTGEASVDTSTERTKRRSAGGVE